MTLLSYKIGKEGEIGNNGCPEIPAQPTFGTLSEQQAEMESFSMCVQQVILLHGKWHHWRQPAALIPQQHRGEELCITLQFYVVREAPKLRLSFKTSRCYRSILSPSLWWTLSFSSTKTQLSMESVAEYIAELQSLLTQCNFGSHLSDALCDCLVCGLRSENMQTRLWRIGPWKIRWRQLRQWKQLIRTL